jgi:hypothetical protein
MIQPYWMHSVGLAWAAGTATIVEARANAAAAIARVFDLSTGKVIERSWTRLNGETGVRLS